MCGERDGALWPFYLWKDLCLTYKTLFAMCWEWLTLHRQRHVHQHFINLSGHTWTSGNMRSVLPTIYSVFHLSVLLPSNLKASPLVKTLLFTMIHMLKRALPLMAAEQHHFRWLNVSLWQTYNFLCMLTGFQSSLIDTHSQKSPLYLTHCNFQ